MPLQRIPYERLTDLSNGTLSGIQYALLADDEGKEQQCAPLFTYLTKRTTGSNVAFTEATTTPLSSYWFPQNVYTENALQEEPALVGNYFGDEIDEFRLNARYFGLGFFNLFWYGITRLMFEPDKRSVTHEAYLPLKILRKLTLADRFIINGNLHLIEAIETNYLSGKSKLKLIRIKPEDLEDFQENQTTITPTGTTYVNYIDTDGKVKHQTLTSQTTITHIGKIKRQL